MKRWTHNVYSDREIYTLDFGDDENVATIEVMLAGFLLSCHVGCTTYSMHRLKATNPDEAKKEVEEILVNLYKYNLDMERKKVSHLEKGLNALSE